jgi:hypothetical protein
MEMLGWWLAYLLVRGTRSVVLEPIAFPVHHAGTPQDLSAEVSKVLSTHERKYTNVF